MYDTLVHCAWQVPKITRGAEADLRLLWHLKTSTGLEVGVAFRAASYVVSCLVHVQEQFLACFSMAAVASWFVLAHRSRQLD